VEFLTVPEVAKRLKISPATVYQLCASRKLAHVRLGAGRGAIRIKEEDLLAFLAGRTVRPEEPAAPLPTQVKLKHLKIN
jgi:excisionase family DNA binding protein